MDPLYVFFCRRPYWFAIAAALLILQTALRIYADNFGGEFWL